MYGAVVLTGLTANMDRSVRKDGQANGVGMGVAVAVTIDTVRATVGHVGQEFVEVRVRVWCAWNHGGGGVAFQASTPGNGAQQESDSGQRGNAESHDPPLLREDVTLKVLKRCSSQLLW